MNARAMQRLGLGLPNNVILISQTTATGAVQMRNDEIHLRTIGLDKAAGATLSMPRSTGSGCTFWVIVLVVPTSNGYVIQTDPTTDSFGGSIGVNLTGSTATSFAAGTSSNNIITLNGTTTGGSQIGDMLEFVDLAVGTWAVAGQVIGTGSVATPFS